MSTGRYIAFEGAEGCGKSTQAALLADRLDAVLTRESGGTRIGQGIRRLLHDPTNVELSPRAEALLLAADRAQHLTEVVEPALARGRHVVSDRSVFSTLAYQGYGRELDLEVIRSINEWAIGGHWPEIVVLLDVHQDEVATRMSGRDLDRFELESAAFFERVAAGFRKMASEDPTRWIVIDGDRSIEAVAADVTTAITARIGARS
jgi:dTMP kinase